MENKNNRKRKALMLLPLLVIPFLTLAFWALGGGSGATGTDSVPQGLNFELPGAHFKKETAEDKLSFYDASRLDADKWKEAAKKDRLSAPDLTGSNGQYRRENDLPATADDNEKKIYRKLADLRMELGSHPDEKELTPLTADPSVVAPDAVLPLTAQKADTGLVAKDPEIDQLNSMMEKIIEVQHPERLGGKVQKEATMDGKRDLSLTRLKFDPAVDFFKKDTTEKPGSAGFFSDDGAAGTEHRPSRTVGAAICETSSVTSGATVKLSLLEDASFAGTVLPAGQLLYGTATLSGDRLKITVTTIRFGEALLPVSLSVYDMDGLEGVSIHGAMSEERVPQEGALALDDIGTTALNPSIGMQAAGAGISAARKVLEKKVRIKKVTITAGYRVLLADDHQLNHQPS